MDAAGDVLGEFLARRRGQLGTDRLTPRMLQVLQLAADGYSGPRIAEYLAVSQQTVASHMKHIYERLGVSDRAMAVAVGIRSGLIE
jgi:two-component system nitrate/nitrite response regulator NarL